MSLVLNLTIPTLHSDVLTIISHEPRRSLCTEASTPRTDHDLLLAIV